MSISLKAPPFKAAIGQADHWGLAVKAALDGLGRAEGGGIEPGHNLGFLYVSDRFTRDLSSILTFLRETTHIRNWVGATGTGICGGGGEIHEKDIAGGAVSVMVGAFPKDGFQVFSGLTDDVAGFLKRYEPLWAEHGPAFGLVHADPRNPDLNDLLYALAAASDSYLVGGLTSASSGAHQIADDVTDGGLSGVLFGSEVRVLTGLSQGCSPIGGLHQVTEAWDDVVLGLDGRPALEVLKEEAGDLIARDLRRAAGYIHVGLPVTGSDTGDYAVRGLRGIDPQRGWLAVGAKLAMGDSLMFVRRDPNAAQEDMLRMLDRLKLRVGGAAIKGGIYISCVARGSHMFGPDREVATIHEELGDFPLTGFFAEGEICHDRFYSYTGVLTLFL